MEEVSRALSDLTTKLTTRALCVCTIDEKQEDGSRNRRIGRNAQDDSKRASEDVLLNSELVAKIELSIFQSHADINRKLQKNFIFKGFLASSGQFFKKLLLDFELRTWT